MSNDPRRIAQTVLEGLYHTATFEIECWGMSADITGDAIKEAQREMALIIWNDHLRVLGYLAEVNHIPWPPAKPRELKLVVNNK